ncbi:unnamed protein product [Bursaphelenchus xylophilus]|uniref:thioredoxin-dependent peroxiredoxin n=1 Tax=Bursaphelenchus xylophilus TaxID=6326 RepID=A0A1I7SWP8_BURXY|nr:unnamed protein product [Bursaphelenchus xylophilus]CAG9099777.1 unnamed protein product [Bursaphelenchus xylophilus]
MVRLVVGSPIEDFETECFFDDEFSNIKLSDYKGKYIVLFFYPHDFQKPAEGELQEFSSRKSEFDSLNTQILAFSTDSKYTHISWIQQGDLGLMEFPMVTDHAHQIGRQYGILDAEAGKDYRTVIIVDPEMIVRHFSVFDPQMTVSVTEVLRLLSQLQNNKMET